MRPEYRSRDQPGLLDLAIEIAKRPYTWPLFPMGAAAGMGMWCLMGTAMGVSGLGSVLKGDRSSPAPEGATSSTPTRERTA